MNPVPVPPFQRGPRAVRWLLGAVLVAWGAVAGLPAGEPGRATLGPPMGDPFCAVTNLAAARGAEGNPSVSPGTARMVRLLGQLRDGPQLDGVPFFSERAIPALERNVAGATNLAQELSARMQLARQWVQAGRSEAALAEYARIAERSAHAPAGGVSPATLRMHRAVAWLKLAELENCVGDRREEACLFPLSARAVHARTRGSRNALRELGAQLDASPGDLKARWLFNLASMTLGEWPGAVPAAWRIPPDRFASEHDPGKFTDVAHAGGLDVDDLAGGCILDDFDGDGRLDVVASAWGMDGQLRFFRNEGGMRFRERTDEAGLTGLVSGLNIQQTDYDNDGKLDIWVLRGAWLGKPGRLPNSLLRNLGDGTFSDVTEQAGLLSFHPTQTSVWFDFDGDGWLDVFIGNESWDPRDPDRCELFRNNRDGTFTECAREVGLDAVGIFKGATSTDYDHDGRPDLFLSRLDGPNLLFRNEGPRGQGGGWRFRELSAEAGVHEVVRGFPTWFFDADNDGNDDLFVCGYVAELEDVAADYLGQRHRGALPRLYRNRGDGTFEDRTGEARLNRLCLAMGANFGDLDNDGWLDLYLGTGSPDIAMQVPNRMFRNAGGHHFQDVTTAAGVGHLQKGHGVAFGDLDDDGDQDIYHVLGGAFPGDRYRNVLFLNPGHAGHWLKLRLEGVRANRAAMGAHLKVVVRSASLGRREIHRTIHGGGSFGSSPLRQEIGLGDATEIVRVEVTWPRPGGSQTLTGLRLDRGYGLREGGEPREEGTRP